MKDYLVTWEIQVSAHDPRDATTQALKIMRDREQTLALNFTVDDTEKRETHHINLGD